MSYLLFFLYAAVILWAIIKIPFFRKSGLTARWLIFLFAVRALAGVVNCYLSYHYFAVSDSLTFHNVGLNEYYFLTNLPGTFFSDLITDHYQNHYSGLFSVTHSFWNNLKLNLIVKSIAVADIFTLRNFYTNTLLFNFMIFFGSIALFRVFNNRFKTNRYILIACIFFFPSALFYTSNIHKDGLVFLFIGLIVYLMDKMLQSGFRIRRFLLILLCLLLIFSFRNFVSLIIIPGLFAWWISYKQPRYASFVYLAVFLFCALLFFSARNFFPSADFPAFVAQRRASFEFISGVSNTYLPLGVLPPTFVGFMKSTPISLYHAFVLPYVWSISHLLLLPFAIEVALVWLLVILWLWKSNNSLDQPLLLFLAFVCLINIAMIGFTIPNLGAIIRYRSIYLQLLALCLAVSINWSKILHYIK